MGNMKLGGNKLIANIARFARENVANHQPREGVNNGTRERVRSNNLHSVGMPSHPQKVHKEVSKGKSLTINKLCESLGTKRVKRSKNDGKSTIRMQEINIEWIFTSLLLSRYRGKDTCI
ncbi:hypothetical protein HanLR1_Chr16g0607571 [Helianthus annuus]|nr:hypothetical protein HanHA89_Chr16g0646431 [Helianthus annuus]KAJ0639780.1 hypothetical protein HanLR1_Chr16g0607571 [Helianthus annuus]